MRVTGRPGTAEVRGVPWAYTESGEGALALFLHGTLTSKAMFEQQIAELSMHMRCVALDWPGHADSGHDPDGWSVEDLVEAIPDIVSQLGAERVALVGLSQGGAISLRVALRHPELVGRLVTIGAGPDGPPIQVARDLADLGLALGTLPADERRARLRELQPGMHSPGWIDAHPAEAERELDVMVSHDPAALPLLTRIPGMYGTVEDELSSIACPTHVIWGEHDPRASWGPRMIELIPDATLDVIPDAGHHVPLDNPDATTRALQDFFRRHPWSG